MPVNCGMAEKIVADSLCDCDINVEEVRGGAGESVGAGPGEDVVRVRGRGDTGVQISGKEVAGGATGPEERVEIASGEV